MSSLSQLSSPVRMRSWLLSVWRRARQSYTEYHAHAGFKIRYAAAVGLAAFPLFGLVWTYVVPQPYENWTARTVGTLLCLGLATSPRMPLALRRFTIPFSFVTFVYSLPFFFTFMLLMNDATLEWQLSTMAALVYMVFLINTLNVIPAAVIGTGLAVIAYVIVSPDPHIPENLVTSLPIYLFTLVGLVLLNHSGDVIVRAKMRAAQSLAGYIAHEMRTPLASIRMDAESIETVLTPLVAANEWAVSKGYKGGAGNANALRRLAGTARRIQQQTETANAVIDTLLVNITGPGPYDGDTAVHSVEVTLSELLVEVPFKPGQREKIDVVIQENFDYRGSQILVKHAIFNLLRNALRAVGSSEGRVSVTVARTAHYNLISVSDEGAGVPPELVDQLFVPFRSFSTDTGGTGLGLSFCRIVAETLGGTIVYRGEPGKGAIFEIRIPFHSNHRGGS